jgi:hypothetical protein
MAVPSRYLPCAMGANVQYVKVQTWGMGLRYVAAIVAFIVTYFVATLAYGELFSAAIHQNFIHSRPALLGFLMLLISLAGAVLAFWLLS